MRVLVEEAHLQNVCKTKVAKVLTGFDGGYTSASFLGQNQALFKN